MNQSAITRQLYCVPAILSLFMVTPVLAEETTDSSVELPTVSVTSQNANELGYIELEKEPKVGKLAVPTQDQPFSVSIVDPEFMKDTGAKTIQDALLYTPGVYAGNFGLDTRIDGASVRGINAGRYRDGLREVYGSYNSVRTNIYALESLEVLKGPSSMLYGQGDLGGLINSVSKLPKAEKGGEIWGQYGSFNRKQIAFDVTGPIDDDEQFLYRIVGLQRDSDTQVDHVEDDGYMISPSFTWNISDKTRLSLLFNRQENKGQISAQFLPQDGTLDRASQGYIGSETFVGEPGWDKYDREKTEVTVFFDHQFADNWTFSTTARYTDSSSETREHWVDIPSNPSATNGLVNRTIFMADAETQIFNIDARVNGVFDLGATRHNLVVGIDRQDAKWEQDNYFSGRSLGGTINVFDPQYGNLQDQVLNPQDRPDNEIKQTGVYVADHIEIGKVVLSAGLRHDWAENRTLALTGPDTVSDEEETTGRIGLMYRFDNGLSPYVSYAEAFSMNLGNDGTAAANTLKPTTGDQEEVGIKYLSPDKSLAITVAYFDITQENRISDGATPGGVEQIGAVVDGWELQINKRWDNFETQLGYTDLNAKNDSTGERLPYVAEQIATWWNKLYLGNNWRVGAGIRYIGDNVGSDYGAGAGPKIPSETLYDAMLGYSIDQWDFTLDAKNLTDEEFISWCRGDGFDCGYGERRNVTANVRYSF
ncbi:TonB-dependent siderophore receptor [Methylophaga sp. OBS3]|uniref:TonB-dependent siderophore receptor n=1 Tax=Methylophaga sp. OBS3 TaxID=2991934 RepID=UPI002258B91F|nr:TonB-dependent siderophore receptor [Methylophaga sp. OBS3]MCX4189832.1 TonB-dependent siderophore receptor [Methylophaga sp. OBS3]